MLVFSFVPQKAREAKASRFVTTLLAQERIECTHSALQQLAADELPLILKAGSGLDCELGADVHWLMRSAGSALKQLAADKLPLIFKPGSGLDCELGAGRALVDAVCWLSFAAAGCG
ncbi:hypothetical protein KAM471c_40470 [Aeromonas caviae]|nr:hypothetical protein KAM471c_40470 [Aeromonas caviae]GKR35544.1 hypothetical protein KAM471_13080 [Aeromonas caviae]